MEIVHNSLPKELSHDQIISRIQWYYNFMCAVKREEPDDNVKEILESLINDYCELFDSILVERDV